MLQNTLPNQLLTFPPWEKMLAVFLQQDNCAIIYFKFTMVFQTANLYVQTLGRFHVLCYVQTTLSTN